MRSRHGARPSRHSSRDDSTDISTSATGRIAGDPRAGEAARRQARAALATVSVQDGTDQRDEERQQHQAQPAIDGGAVRAATAGARARSRADAARAAARDAADAHQPAEQQPRDLLGPGDRLVQDVAADHLQADDRGLRDDQAGDRPVQRALDPRRDESAPAVPVARSRADRLEPRRRRRARAPRAPQRSAAGCKARASISRIVMPRSPQRRRRRGVLDRAHRALHGRGLERRAAERRADVRPAAAPASPSTPTARARRRCGACAP